MAAVCNRHAEAPAAPPLFQTLIDRLDAAMRNLYARRPDKLAAWKSATHVERAAKKTPPPPAPAPPTP